MKYKWSVIIRVVLVVLFVLCLSGCKKQASANKTNIDEINTDFPKYEETGKKLSEMPDEELMDFLLNAGLEIPEGCDVPEDNVKMIRFDVEMLESDPDWVAATNMVHYLNLCYRVKVIVSIYYGHDDIAEKTMKQSRMFN